MFTLRLPLPGVFCRFLALELEPFRSQGERFLVVGILGWNVFCWLVRVSHVAKICKFGPKRVLDLGLLKTNQREMLIPNNDKALLAYLI